MKDTNKRMRKLIVICVLSLMIIIVAVAFVLNFMNDLLFSANIQNVEELAKHDIKNITAVQNMIWEQLEFFYTRVKNYGVDDMESLKKLLAVQRANSRFDRIVVIDSGHNAVTSMGEYKPVGEDWQRIIDEFTNGSKTVFVHKFTEVSPDNPEEKTEYMLYGVKHNPITVDGRDMIATLGMTPLGNLEKTLLTDCYNSQGYSLVFDNRGDILVNLNIDRTQSKRENFYSQVGRALDFKYGYSLEKMRELNNNREKYTMMYTDENGTEKVLCASPVDNTDWTFTVVIPYRVFENQSMPFLLLISILLIVVLAVMVVVTWVLYYALNSILSSRAEAQARSALLSNMSHEIRTPLNGIIGLNHLMNLYINDKEKMAEYLEKSNNAAHYLLSLVNDILDVSKLQANSMELASEPFDIKKLIESAEDIERDVFVDRGINFLSDTDISHPWLCGDELRIQQVIINILSNAAKFTSHGGHVTLKATQELKGSDEVQTVIIISDDGCGMSKEFQERIFDSFTQERGKNAESVKGTGLGMAISYLIMKLIGGSISVDSELGKGSTFTVKFTLPISDSAPYDINAEHHEEGEEEALSLNVLLAEDNPLNAEIMTEILRNAGIKVTHVTDGRQAVNAFKNSAPHEFDVILMDVRMPEMDGYEASTAIRKLDREDACSVLIYACTANAFKEDEKEAYDSGMNDFLIKPVDVNMLMKKVRAARKQ